MTTHRRVLLASLAAISLTAALAPAADAQQSAFASTTHYYEADAAALAVTVFGTNLVEVATTHSVSEDAGPTTAEAFSVTAMDRSMRIGVSTASVTSPGTAQRDPGDDGASHCSALGIPAELDTFAGLLQLADTCSSSVASVDALGVPTAVSSASGGSLVVNGRAVSQILLDLLLEPIVDQIQGTLDPISDAVTTPVDSALRQVCQTLPADVTAAGLVESAEAAGLPVRDAILALPDGQTMFDGLGDECLLSLEALQALRDVAVDLAIDEIRNVLIGALDRDLLTLDLGGSTSAVTTTDDRFRVSATTDGLSVTSPSLQFLVDAIQVYLAGLVDQAVADVSAIVPAPLDGVVASIPATSALIAQITENLPLDLLIDDHPLLTVQVAPSVAIADFTSAGDAVDTSASTAPHASVTLSPAIARLLGVEPVTTAGPGEDIPIAAGTPLESRIRIGVIETATETLGTSQVPTTAVRVLGAQLSLLTQANGGVVLDVAPATARAGATPTLAVSTLPTTGGNAKPALVVATMLAATVLFLRRRSNEA